MIYEADEQLVSDGLLALSTGQTFWTANLISRCSPLQPHDRSTQAESLNTPFLRHHGVKPQHTFGDPGIFQGQSIRRHIAFIPR
jgi:hypothetical protein